MMFNALLALPLLFAILCIPVLVGVYVCRDAKRRQMNAPLWTLIAVVTPSLIGFIIYLLVRGNFSALRCPQCDGTVTDQYVVCPQCGAKLRPACPNCNMPIEPEWKVCPKCATPLPETPEEINTPVKPRDKTLWKILLAVILIPVLLILALGLSFSAASGGGASSAQEMSFDEYFEDEEIPDDVKAYVRDWLTNMPQSIDEVYGLVYERTYEPERRDGRNDYYYLLYVPGSANAHSKGFGYSSGLFGDTFTLNLNTNSTEDCLYSVATTAKNKPPRIKVTRNGEPFTVQIEQVAFNPSSYIIFSEDDMSALAAAAGDVYLEETTAEMQPVFITVTKYVGGQEAEGVGMDEKDFIMDTLAAIAGAKDLEEPPSFLSGYSISDSYTIRVRFEDHTGESQHEDELLYCAIEEDGEYYLLTPSIAYQDEQDTFVNPLPDDGSIHVSRIDAVFYDTLSTLFE